MRTLIALSLSMIAAPAAAQVTPWPGAAPLDQHRYETQRLRIEADRRQSESRLHRLETDARIREVEAMRQPPLYVTPGPRPLGSPDEERAAREAATVRRRATARSVGEIDAWLDRTSR